MVNFWTLTDQVFAEPFCPLRVRTTSGKAFEIRRPECVAVGRNTLAVFSSSENDPDGPRRWHDIPLASIESVEPLEAPVHRAV